MKILLVFAALTLASCVVSGGYKAINKKTTGFINVVTDCQVSNTGKDTSKKLKRCLENLTQEAAVYFKPGVYILKEPVIISGNSINLFTDTYAIARIDYLGCDRMITFTKNKKTIFNSGFKNIWLRAISDCKSTGITVIDGSQIEINSLKITDFDVGVRVLGREKFHIKNVFIRAKRPIVLGKNPNHINLDADHAHIENVYSIVEGNGYHITIEDGTTVTSMTVDGQNAFAKGCGIVMWKTTRLLPRVSYHLKLENIRFEQSQKGCDKPIYIDLKASRPLHQFTMDNIRIEGKYIDNATAIYLGNVKSVAIRDTSYPNNKPSKFIYATNADYIELSNNFMYLDAEIDTNLDFVNGPFRGKVCCNPDGKKSIVSGILTK